MGGSDLDSLPQLNADKVTAEKFNNQIPTFFRVIALLITCHSLLPHRSGFERLL
jgi:hypothetical protein